MSSGHSVPRSTCFGKPTLRYESIPITYTAHVRSTIPTFATDALVSSDTSDADSGAVPEIYGRSGRELRKADRINNGATTTTDARECGAFATTRSQTDGTSCDPDRTFSVIKSASPLCDDCKADSTEAQVDQVSYTPIHRWTAEEVLWLTLDSLVAARRYFASNQTEAGRFIIGEAIGRIHESGVLPRGFVPTDVA